MTIPKSKTFRQCSPSGYVLVELAVVITLMALLVGIVVVPSVGPIRRARVHDDISKFCQTLRLVAEEAVLQNRRFTIVIDVTNGYYNVYEEKAKTDYDMYDEPVLGQGSLDISYIEQAVFQDGKHTLSGNMELKATPNGWQQSVLLDLIDDRMEQPHYIRFDQGTTRVMVSRQKLELPAVKKDLSL
ncbi:MAG: hypothetical protein K9M57_00090 [Phycisphaerae bacterium]|nr:hypothetical protein [Phycisphaerae bacterium]